LFLVFCSYLVTLLYLQESEAKSYEARLKSKESEVVKAAEEGFKIRFEEQTTNLAVKEKELGEHVRLVRDLDVQLTAMIRERDGLDVLLNVKSNKIREFDELSEKSSVELGIVRGELEQQRRLTDEVKKDMEKQAEKLGIELNNLRQAKVSVLIFQCMIAVCYNLV
jgi:hypothetical protein